MTFIKVTSEAQFDDDEAAACIAAVVQLMQRRVEAEKPKPVSNWQLASRLEAAMPGTRIDAKTFRGTVWKTSSLLKLVVLLLVVSTSPTLAQTWQSTSNMPKPAPDFRTEAIPDAVPEQAQAPDPALVTESKACNIRVGLAIDAPTIDVGTPDGALVKDATTGRVLAELPAQSRWRVSLASPGGYKQLRFNGTIGNAAAARVALIMKSPTYRDVAYTPNAPRSFDQPLVLNSFTPGFWLPIQSWKTGDPTPGRDYLVEPLDRQGVVSINGKLYRGSLVVQTRANNTATVLNAINSVDVEDYLLSVVPGEMPSKWPLEALKAQAIAARSYAIANIGKHGSSGYDVKANTEDQVYSGVSSETEQTNQAVAETKRLILKCQGKPVTAFFHSTSGGCTETSENVWSKPLPFLKAVPDFDDESPHFAWNRTVSVDDLDAALRKASKDVGGVLAMLPISRGNSPRVKSVLIAGRNKTLVLSGEQLRGVLTLPSTNFNVGCVQNAYVFAGRGFGHGLGMSQWGARRLASDGYNAGQILSYYYKEITIEPI